MASFDLVFSSLALHYVRDFAGVCRNVARMLVPGGSFVFSVEHPVFTARAEQEWWTAMPTATACIGRSTATRTKASGARTGWRLMSSSITGPLRPRSTR